MAILILKQPFPSGVPNEGLSSNLEPSAMISFLTDGYFSGQPL
jgi:hypothetical protein